MKKLKQRILEFENISKELDPSEVKRNKYLQQIQDYTRIETNIYNPANVSPELTRQ